MPNNHLRLAEMFARADKAGRCAVIPFVVAGDPDIETSRNILEALQEEGVDAIEVGIPYSDPLADGPSIVAAGQRALQSGATFETALDLIQGLHVPTILFTYANPVVQYGVESLAKRLIDHHAAGVIIPDIPLEEVRSIAEVFAEYRIDMPLLVAPTTPQPRAERIAEAARGFIYLVSRLGVTGANRILDIAAIRKQAEQLRACSTLPIAVGFGISERRHVAELASFADGVIIGSALIDAFAHLKGQAAVDAARSFIAGVSQGNARTSSVH